jgi:hypothetical protein
MRVPDHSPGGFVSRINLQTPQCLAKMCGGESAVIGPSCVRRGLRSAVSYRQLQLPATSGQGLTGYLPRFPQLEVNRSFKTLPVVTGGRPSFERVPSRGRKRDSVAPFRTDRPNVHDPSEECKPIIGRVGCVRPRSAQPCGCGRCKDWRIAGMLWVSGAASGVSWLTKRQLSAWWWVLVAG